MIKLINTLQWCLLTFVPILILTGTGRGFFICLMISHTERKSIMFVSPIKCSWPTQKKDFVSFSSYQQLFLTTVLQSSHGDCLEADSLELGIVVCTFRKRFSVLGALVFCVPDCSTLIKSWSWFEDAEDFS